MKESKQILTAKKTISMSKKAEEKLTNIAKIIKGKELFPEKTKLAKKTLSTIKSLPI